MQHQLMVLLLLAVCLSVQFIVAQPPPPSWPEKWAATTGVASDYPSVAFRTSASYYDWTHRRFFARIVNMNNARGGAILHHNTTVWAVDYQKQSCCIDPNQSGVTPPRPNWLQGATYNGVMMINGVKCNVWEKDVVGVADFAWAAAVDSGRPCALIFGGIVNAFGVWTTNTTFMPDDIWEVPKYCPTVITDPNCSILEVLNV